MRPNPPYIVGRSMDVPAWNRGGLALYATLGDRLAKQRDPPAKQRDPPATSSCKPGCPRAVPRRP
ncbi:hypothetical protein GT354_18575 [Streptomyces sp. SID3343]|nr:hypothetical protein [Streptomyces sp. SID3343]